MDKILIKESSNLSGIIKIDGSKNIALALLPVLLLTDKKIELINIPNVNDVTLMIQILLNLNVDLCLNGDIIYDYSSDIKSCIFDCSNVINNPIDYEIVKQMRASIHLLCPMLSRFGECTISLPGGCALGTRAIDLHLDIVRKMGAEIIIENGYIKAKGKLKGCEIEFPINSVGATENAITAAVMAEGDTIIKNAAIEPEVVELCKFLISLGAKISGVGTRTLIINGVRSLNGGKFFIEYDRIEAGSYAILAGATNGRLILKDLKIDLFKSVENEFNQIGIKLESVEGGVMASRATKLKPMDIETKKYPGFPTDLHPQIACLLSLIDPKEYSGFSSITENIFDGRFNYALELNRLGAEIKVDKNIAKIKHVGIFTGANVMASDLRCGFTLIMAGLVAKGETVVDRIYHLERGYSHLTEKLFSCGADIRKISE